MIRTDFKRIAINELSESDARLLCWYSALVLESVISAFFPEDKEGYTILVELDEDRSIDQEIAERGHDLSVWLEKRTDQLEQEAN